MNKIDPKYELLPTGKPHVSFSEIREWRECSYRHKLKFIDKIGDDKPGVNLDFGTSIHAACENFLKTRKMDRKIFLSTLKELWEKHSQICPEEFTTDAFVMFAKQGMSILSDVPQWLDKQFPGWEYIDAEHPLYEPISVDQPHAFKGFIDVVIKANGPRGKSLFWLLDWKTTSWGWSSDKKNDELTRSQLVLYKNFWSTKTKIDPKNVRCGFVLLKRTAKPNNHCELVTASVGGITTDRSLKVINNMLSSIKKGIALKNRDSCQYCAYRNTTHCT
jgi:hypothetical protein